jgi:hypothetical protein
MRRPRRSDCRADGRQQRGGTGQPRPHAHAAQHPIGNGGTGMVHGAPKRCGPPSISSLTQPDRTSTIG